MADVHGWLSSERPAGVLTDPIGVQLTTAELHALDDKAPADPRIKVGISKKLLHPVSFHQSGGVFAQTADGGYVWSVAIESSSAHALRLRFASTDLPDDADLYVYNQAGEVYGPYLGRGPHGNGAFWSHAISGSTAIVALRFHGQASPSDVENTSAFVTHLAHLGPAYLATPHASTCSYNAECVEDVSCYSSSDWSSIDMTSNGTALLLFQSGHGPWAGWYLCSGGLIADTDDSSEIPYLLTANHCFSSQKEADTLEAAFFYKTDACGSGDGCDANVFDLGNKVLGSDILATGKTGDFNLVRLDQAPPSGVTYMGWNATSIAHNDGAALHRVSHPQGAPQSYSQHDVSSTAPSCGTLPRGDFIYSRDTLGATEGGSSGSPVLNQDGQIVGQLYGACGTNLGDECDAENNATVDGAFAAYFDQVAPYLAPTPSTCEPSAEVCDDAFDNDCDGATDCDDSDCTGDVACESPACVGTGTTPKGEACTSDPECCSVKCRGAPGRKLCR